MNRWCKNFNFILLVIFSYFLLPFKVGEQHIKAVEEFALVIEKDIDENNYQCYDTLFEGMSWLCITKVDWWNFLTLLIFKNWYF